MPLENLAKSMNRSRLQFYELVNGLNSNVDLLTLAAINGPEGLYICEHGGNSLIYTSEGLACLSDEEINHFRVDHNGNLLVSYGFADAELLKLFPGLTYSNLVSGLEISLQGLGIPSEKPEEIKDLQDELYSQAEELISQRKGFYENVILLHESDVLHRLVDVSTYRNSGIKLCQSEDNELRYTTEGFVLYRLGHEPERYEAYGKEDRVLEVTIDYENEELLTTFHGINSEEIINKIKEELAFLIRSYRH